MASIDWAGSFTTIVDGAKSLISLMTEGPMLIFTSASILGIGAGFLSSFKGR